MICIGSTNQAKVSAVKKVFEEEMLVTAVHVPSGVGAQPLSDEETKKGAYNRAQAVKRVNRNAIGIGLEGGVMKLDGKMFLTNWGVLIDEFDQAYFASGARIPLPDSFISELEQGIELSELMEDYTNQKNIRHHQGAIGIFTNNQLTRQSMFEHILMQLKGQVEYYTKEENTV